MYGIGCCLKTPSGGGNSSMKILEMYETSQANKRST
nr:MAG TPA_asm: hypothetical protein [Caudoviricetes sp.]